MKRFLEPEAVRTIRDWLSKQVVDGDSVDGTNTPIYLGPIKLEPDGDTVREVSSFRAPIITKVLGYTTRQVVGNVSRKSFTTHWMVTAELCPYTD